MSKLFPIFEFGDYQLIHRDNDGLNYLQEQDSQTPFSQSIMMLVVQMTTFLSILKLVFRHNDASIFTLLGIIFMGLGLFRYLRPQLLAMQLIHQKKSIAPTVCTDNPLEHHHKTVIIMFLLAILSRYLYHTHASHILYLGVSLPLVILALVYHVWYVLKILRIDTKNSTSSVLAKS